jgi:two-component system, chemotaxis family, response regulator Rcp1
VPEQVVLHVEDEDAVASLLQMLLNESWPPLRLFRVNDGEEALAFMHQTGDFVDAPRPDLILLDLGLPFRSGFEVLEYMRDDEHLRSLRVVVFSSSGVPSDRERVLELGALDFITKRPSVQGMRAAIKQIRSYLPKQPS